MFFRFAVAITVCFAAGAGLRAQHISILIPTTHPDATQMEAGPATGPAGPGSLYVSGKVAVSDNSELPPNVVMAKVCGNKREALGYVDKKGSFSVKLAGSSLAALLDASDDNRGEIGKAPSPLRGQGGNNLLGCELIASFPGYRSDRVNLSSRRSMDNPDVGTILLRRLGEGTGTTVSETMLAAPKKALKIYERGMGDLRKGDTASARKSFEKAVEIDPNMAGAWYELGHLLMRSDTTAAKAALEKAVVADGKYSLPYADLTLLAYRKEDWPETLRLSETGLKLDSSGSPSLYFFNSATHLRLQQYEEAEKMARTALKVDYGHTMPRTSELLGYILEARHDYAGAAEQLHSYLAINPPDSDKVEAELARINNLLNRSR